MNRISTGAAVLSVLALTALALLGGARVLPPYPESRVGACLLLVALLAGCGAALSAGICVARRRCSRADAGLALLLSAPAVLLAVLLALSMAWHGLTLRGGYDARRVRCRERLGRIAVAVDMYSADHGRLPSELGDLTRGRYLDASALRCFVEDAAEPQVRGPGATEEVDIVYYAPNKDMGGRDLPIAWERHIPPGRAHIDVLWTSGHVSQIGVKDLRQVITDNRDDYEREPVPPEVREGGDVGP